MVLLIAVSGNYQIPNIGQLGLPEIGLPECWLGDFKRRLDETRLKTADGSALAKAIDYTLRRWPGSRIPWRNCPPGPTAALYGRTQGSANALNSAPALATDALTATTMY